MEDECHSVTGRLTCEFDSKTGSIWVPGRIHRKILQVPNQRTPAQDCDSGHLLRSLVRPITPLGLRLHP